VKILVVGGAGYIGSHMVYLLVNAGFEVVVLDDLSGGFATAVSGAELIVGSISNRNVVANVFSDHKIDGVMHFASFIQVSESVVDPAKYYENNVSGSMILLDEMRKANVNNFVFSSTAAIYGNPLTSLIEENHVKAPINPYGRSKWMMEQLLQDYDHAYGLRSVSLRYFNAAGAAANARLGERHNPETHLIPLVLQVASGRRDHISVFGVDYDTADGTCIRDYVHVLDICHAHLLALNYLVDGGRTNAFNLGNGEGFSVRQVIEVASRVTKKPIPISHYPRRAGDPPQLVANATKASQILHWVPKRSGLDSIIADAWTWEQSHEWK
jgi:UDP-glucose 4-epimerase